MPTVQATVVAQTDDELTVSATRQASCAHCRQQDHCGFYALDSLTATTTELTFALDNAIDQSITLTCDEQSLRAYIALLFLPTLLSMISVILLLSSLHTSDVFIALSCPVSASVGFLLSKFLLRKKEKTLMASVKIQK